MTTMRQRSDLSFSDKLLAFNAGYEGVESVKHWQSCAVVFVE